MVGDFDGDAALDVLMTSLIRGSYVSQVLWGDTNSLTTGSNDHMFHSDDYPIAIDINNDLVIDFFGTFKGVKLIWQFLYRKNVTQNCESVFNPDFCYPNKTIYKPITASYVDIDGDNSQDLVLGMKFFTLFI